MTGQHKKSLWPWVVFAHFVIALSTVLVIWKIDPKESLSEQQFRVALEGKEQRIAQQSDEIAKLRHQLLVLAAERGAPLEQGSDQEGE